MQRNIWEGIYDSFAQVPAKGNGYSAPGWVDRAEKRIREIRQISASSGKIPATVHYKENLLPFLTSIVSHGKTAVRILDFGGGLGWTYVAVRDAQEGQGELSYDIVETVPMCVSGERVWKNEKNLRFLSGPPEEPYHADIVHIGSVLQYIDEWQQLLRRLTDYAPGYVLFSDLPAGSIPTFVSAQRYYDSILPYRFYNIDEVVQNMKSLGYRSIFRSRYVSTILEKEQPYPLENFPETHRLGDSCNLLFIRL